MAANMTHSTFHSVIPAFFPHLSLLQPLVFLIFSLFPFASLPLCPPVLTASFGSRRPHSLPNLIDCNQLFLYFVMIFTLSLFSFQFFLLLLPSAPLRFSTFSHTCCAIFLLCSSSASPHTTPTFPHCLFPALCWMMNLRQR